MVSWALHAGRKKMRLVIEKITIPLKDVDAEWKERLKHGQCMEMTGGRSIVFCTRPKGHKGSHRGLRKQWRWEEVTDEEGKDARQG